MRGWSECAGAVEEEERASFEQIGWVKRTQAGGEVFGQWRERERQKLELRVRLCSGQ